MSNLTKKAALLSMSINTQALYEDVQKTANNLPLSDGPRHLHPDTIRLNHLIEMDRCVIDPDGPMEKIEFVFENKTRDTGPDVVRAAIDNSIRAHQRIKKGMN